MAFALASQDIERMANLIASLGYVKEDDVYITNPECLDCLEAIEIELCNDDISKRDVRMYLGFNEVVKTDLIPILIHSKDSRIYKTVVRLLVNLTLPAECLVALTNFVETRTIMHQMQSYLMRAIHCFLVPASTSSLVTTLRDEIMKAERYQIPLNNDNCEHLKNCLLLLRNILHCPDEADSAAAGITKEGHGDWQCMQNKLVWNLLVQGLDGALLLMLNSTYKVYWTEPLVQIIALLYKDQNVSRIQRSLESVSSTSESSEEDEESYGSKHSSISLSSEPPKLSTSMNDSGCPFSSSSLSTEDTDGVFILADSQEPFADYTSEINAKLKTFRIKREDSDGDISMESISDYSTGSDEQMAPLTESYTEVVNISSSSSAKNNSSSSSAKNNSSSHHQIHLSADGTLEINNISELNIPSNRKPLSCDRLSSSDENCAITEVSQRNVKLCHKHRNSHSHLKVPESDSSNEDIKGSKSKVRTHLATTWKGKSLTRKPGCAPSICLEAATINNSNNWGRMKYPLWEKRNSITDVLDQNSVEPSSEELGNLLKNFTISFLHSGFKYLVMDLKNWLMDGKTSAVNKSYLFWLLTYFLHFAKTLNLNLKHINDILSIDLIGYLIYESIASCEEMDISVHLFQQVPKDTLRRSHLLVSALKEVVTTVYEYSNKAANSNDRLFCHQLCRHIAEVWEVRQLPLLLHHNYHSSYHSKQYIEDLVILNHHLLLLIERSSDDCWQPKKINIHSHLRQFATQNIVNNYGRLLEEFKINSPFVNDCIFTMMHHLAGDMNAPELLMQPLILKTFSSILKEDFELPQFWEDLIMYILNKFSHQVEVQRKCEYEDEVGNKDSSSCNSEVGVSNVSNRSSNLVLSEEKETDELFWWYLQFETVEDPVAKISEHIMISKSEILQRLLIRGIVSNEKYKELEDHAKQKNSEEILVKMLPEVTIEDKEQADDAITQLLRKLVQTGNHHHLTWIQDQLLKVCYVKSGIGDHSAEPIPYYSCRMMTDVPLVPYSEDQRVVLQDKTFLLLLQKLGFVFGNEFCKSYPRIPIFWSPELLFNTAACIGPIKKERLKSQQDSAICSNTTSEHFSEYDWLSD